MRQLRSMLAGILVAFLFIGAAAAKGGELVPASGNPCLKFLPRDWVVAGNVDLRAIFKWVKETKESPQAAMMEQYIQMLKGFTGIDPEKDLDFVTFFITGNLETDPKFLMVVRGTFQNKVVLDHLGPTIGQNAHAVDSRNGPVYVTPTVGFCLPEEGTLMIGEPNQVVAAASLADADRPAMPEALKKTLDQTNAGALAWAAARPDAILRMAALADWRRENTDLVSNLGKMDCCSLFFDDAPDGFLIHALGNLASQAEARQLSAYLSEQKTALMTREGSNVFGFSILNISAITAANNQVKASLPITAKAMEQIWHTPVILKPGTPVPSPAAP